MMDDLAAVKKELMELRSMLAEVLPLVRPPKALLTLTEAAKVCNVRKAWLLERVQRDEIPAFRSSADAPWRVYVADVQAFLTRESNQQKRPVRQRRAALPMMERGQK